MLDFQTEFAVLGVDYCPSPSPSTELDELDERITYTDDFLAACSVLHLDVADQYARIQRPGYEYDLAARFGIHVNKLRLWAKRCQHRGWLCTGVAGSRGSRAATDKLIERYPEAGRFRAHRAFGTDSSVIENTVLSYVVVRFHRGLGFDIRKGATFGPFDRERTAAERAAQIEGADRRVFCMVVQVHPPDDALPT